MNDIIHEYIRKKPRSPVGRWWYFKKKMFKIRLASRLLRWGAHVEPSIFTEAAFTLVNENYNEFQNWSIDRMRDEVL